MVVLVLFFLLVAAVVILVVLDQRRLAFREASKAGLDHIAGSVSERLHFRFAEYDDKEFFVAMAQDPTAAEANGWNGDEVASVKARFATKKLVNKLRGHDLVAVETATGSRVGTATFAKPADWPSNTLSVGIHIRPDHRKKGFGRELMAAGILIAQHTADQSVVVGTRTTNIGIQKMMGQLGYEPEPGIRPYRAPNGTTYDSYWYLCDEPPVVRSTD